MRLTTTRCVIPILASHSVEGFSTGKPLNSSYSDSARQRRDPSPDPTVRRRRSRGQPQSPWNGPAPTVTSLVFLLAKLSGGDLCRRPVYFIIAMGGVLEAEAAGGPECFQRPTMSAATGPQAWLRSSTCDWLSRVLFRHNRSAPDAGKRQSLWDASGVRRHALPGPTAQTISIPGASVFLLVCYLVCLGSAGWFSRSNRGSACEALRRPG